MSLKSSKRRMRNGFMCHSEASTAVCIAGSVVVPRTRSRRHQRSVSLDGTRLINYAKYSKLVDSSTSSRFNSAHKKCDSVSVPNIKHQENESRELQKKPTDNVFQVVVMRVAIHCQGCAGKVKKHLSKMEDVESKRVTVMGHISPVGVLESISKVKRAEFWDC
ncbi:uncharacterized protein LOC114387579 isoform X2 [Glycine soja]|uniref:Protein SODIUM POTASSIUM ROOT DEFECTIVE 1 isoform B n=1 Tax=Glycine soja TaxID=3848 RepID=A0A445GPI4_GLYSO|nr:uncharacterized protein LOC114387579 isoform X2 [Glycine soja]RZB63166.1 Protein SODIUM POTASSIUM ROOT DEFECTIVE 1 isoform B [Glycine soja]